MQAELAVVDDLHLDVLLLGGGRKAADPAAHAWPIERTLRPDDDSMMCTMNALGVKKRTFCPRVVSCNVHAAPRAPRTARTAALTSTLAASFAPFAVMQFEEYE